MSHPLNGTQRDRIECNGGVSYEVDFSLDTVEATAFYDFQKQLIGVQSEHSLVHAFDSSGRCGLGAVSYIHVESRNEAWRSRRFTPSRMTTRLCGVRVCFGCRRVGSFSYDGLSARRPSIQALGVPTARRAESPSYEALQSTQKAQQRLGDGGGVFDGRHVGGAGDLDELGVRNLVGQAAHFVAR